MTERRESARILTEFSLALYDEKGAALDEHAVAHDVSDKGCKGETQAELKQGQAVRFALELPGGRVLKGKGRIAWCNRTDVMYWTGVEFRGLSWSDRRLLRKLTSPSDVDWDRIADHAITALVLLILATVAWSALNSPAWRSVLGDMTPKIIAAVIAGLALRAFLTP